MSDLNQLMLFLEKAGKSREEYEKNKKSITNYLKELKLSRISDCCLFQESAINFLKDLCAEDSYSIANVLRLVDSQNIPIELRDDPGKEAVTISKSGVVQINVLYEFIKIASGLGINETP